MNQKTSRTQKRKPSRSKKSAKPNLLARLPQNVLPLLALVTIGLVAGAVVLLHNLIGNADGFKLVNGQGHHSSGLGFSATYPTGWTIEDKDASSSLIGKLTATDAKSFNDIAAGSAIILVFREPVSGDLNKVSSAIFADDPSDKTLKKHVLNRSDLTVGDLPAKSQESTSTVGHEEDILVVDANNVGYFFTLSTPETKWQQLQPVLQTFVRTIKFDK